jgi:hypothetical protein
LRTCVNHYFYFYGAGELICCHVQDKNLTRSYRLETAEKLKQVEELTDTEHPKVFHVTRCAICKAQLDLPAVHFMCNHSYHQRYVASQFKYT